MSGGGEEGYEELPFALDIIIEILKRLPIKSLIKFMSVSKQWKSIIKSSTFVSDHNRYVQQLPPSSYDPFFVCCNRRRLIGYSQGLFGFLNNIKDRLVIWNPFIRKSVFIPFPPDHRFPTYDDDDFCFTVVCNATEPTIFKISDDYKPMRLQIYTPTAGAWKTVSSTLPRESLHIQQRKVTDRFIYWIARPSKFFNCSANHMILSFDITSERFTELCLPPTLAIPERDTYLKLSQHRESLVVLKHHKKKHELGVRMLEPDVGVQNLFAKKFTVKLPDTKITPNFSLYSVNWNPVLGFTKYGQLILLMLYFPRE
uniref:F-box protein At2g21930-like n=1 Tax=Erigeron canadensis TaxID=72917 RepID=UPI001CB9A384|nr:F-box protein At2g21930-like [Erigeron canadensis]